VFTIGRIPLNQKNGYGGTILGRESRISRQTSDVSRKDKAAFLVKKNKSS